MFSGRVVGAIEWDPCSGRGLWGQQACMMGSRGPGKHILQQMLYATRLPMHVQMLSVSHMKGIAHGDLKPDNVFVDLQNCHRMTHVLDWGLAHKHEPGTSEQTLRIALLFATLQ